MPKPLLLRRPSGLYARFRLPSEVFRRLDVRFMVRSLGALRGDAARLVAARMGYALARAIETTGERVDKKLLDAALAAAQRGEVAPYKITTTPGGGITVEAEGADEHARALQMLGAMQIAIPGLGMSLPPAAAVPVPAAPPPAPVAEKDMLHGAMKIFLAKFRGLGRASSTVDETEHSLSLFRDLVDDVPLAQLDHEHLDHFRAEMAHWPPRARILPVYRDLPNARAIIAAAKARGDGGTLADRSVDKHLDRLRVFFNWAVKRRLMPFNPLAGERVQTVAQKYESARRSFQPDELRVLFDPVNRAPCAADPMRFWVPVLALFLGARLGEVAQLYVRDVGEVGDVWGVHITPEGKKRLKNAQSKRFVPLPQRVLDLGFLDFVADAKARGFEVLFPSGSWEHRNGPGNNVSKWFNRSYLRVSCGLTDPGLAFHSFRHTWETVADLFGVSEKQAGGITGHTARSVQSRFYIDALTVPQRRILVDRVAASFDLPPLAAYQPDQFAAFYRGLPHAQKRSERRRSAAQERAAARRKARGQ
jgi:integrase